MRETSRMSTGNIPALREKSRAWIMRSMTKATFPDIEISYEALKLAIEAETTRDGGKSAEMISRMASGGRNRDVVRNFLDDDKPSKSKKVKSPSARNLIGLMIALGVDIGDIAPKLRPKPTIPKAETLAALLAAVLKIEKASLVPQEVALRYGRAAHIVLQQVANGTLVEDDPLQLETALTGALAGLAEQTQRSAA